MPCLLPGHLVCEFLPFRFILLHFSLSQQRLESKTANCLELWTDFHCDYMNCVSPWYNRNGWLGLKTNVLPTYLSSGLHHSLHKQEINWTLASLSFKWSLKSRRRFAYFHPQKPRPENDNLNRWLDDQRGLATMKLNEPGTQKFGRYIKPASRCSMQKLYIRILFYTPGL